MNRLAVRFDCPSCGFGAPAAIEIPEELGDRWLEVRAAGFQSHVRDGSRDVSRAGFAGSRAGFAGSKASFLSMRATRAEARRAGDDVSVRGSCPSCGSDINLPVCA